MEFESLVEEGRYQEAFNQLDPKGLEDASYRYQAQYDILNVLIHGRKVKKEGLFTYQAFLKYPDSISWTILGCKVLVNYLDTGTVDTETLETMKKYNPDKLLWLKPLQDLNKPR
ncbi:MAG: hypothetical protein GY814_14765 [Gammaproteobacteria bacterium]|nr:hypothetical protein [Gammaproteobacteria bacterium]